MKGKIIFDEASLSAEELKDFNAYAERFARKHDISVKDAKKTAMVRSYGTYLRDLSGTHKKLSV